jgi:hypothetical protein
LTTVGYRSVISQVAFPFLWQRANYKLVSLLSAEKDAANLVRRPVMPEGIVFAYSGVHR